MDPPVPTPSVSGHALLGPLDDAAVDALLATVGPGTSSALLFAELRHIGGAVARPAPDAALSHLPGLYTLFGAAVAPTPAAAEAGRASAAELVEAMAPWSETTRVLTLTETLVDTATGFDPESWGRLREVRAALDPAGVFLAGHEIG
jgi:FAD/FMN-containing dehydrogenase